MPTFRNLTDYADGTPGSTDRLFFETDAGAPRGVAPGDVPAIQAGVSTNSNTAITVNAASFGDRQFIKILCSGTTAITVTLANDVPAGKAVELVAYHATADVTAQAGSGATLVKPASSFLTTTEQYEAMVYEVDTNTGTNAAWRLVARP